MPEHNSPGETYAPLAKFLHWLMAAMLVCLFALGFWMVDLTYYDNWYTRAPYLHKSFGMIFMAALLVRVITRVTKSPPQHALSPREQKLSKFAHYCLYLLMLILVASGYLISTADGRPVAVFSVFQLPALIKSEGLESIAGDIHEYCAYCILTLATLHGAVALKHRFVNKDKVLQSMLWQKRQ